MALHHTSRGSQDCRGHEENEMNFAVDQVTLLRRAAAAEYFPMSQLGGGRHLSSRCGRRARWSGTAASGTSSSWLSMLLCCGFRTPGVAEQATAVPKIVLEDHILPRFSLTHKKCEGRRALECGAGCALELIHAGRSSNGSPSMPVPPGLTAMVTRGRW